MRTPSIKKFISYLNQKFAKISIHYFRIDNRVMFSTILT
jgi:hypothetical protein